MIIVIIGVLLGLVIGLGALVVGLLLVSVDLDRANDGLLDTVRKLNNKLIEEDVERMRKL